MPSFPFSNGNGQWRKIICELFVSFCLIIIKRGGKCAFFFLNGSLKLCYTNSLFFLLPAPLPRRAACIAHSSSLPVLSFASVGKHHHHKVNQKILTKITARKSAERLQTQCCQNNIGRLTPLAIS